MVKYKLVFCDFDDTLVASGCAIGDKTRSAIAEYRAAGGTFVICTGRSRASLEKRLEAVYGGAPDVPYICLQGGIIVDGGREIRHLCVGSDDVVRAADAARLAGLDLAFHADNRIFSERRTHITESYSALTGCPIEYAEPGADIAREYVGKFDKLMILSSPETRSAAEEVSRMHMATARFMFSGPTYLELVPADSGKGEAVRFMTNRLGFSESDVAAFGDAENDVDMLRAAALPVAIRGGMRACLDAAKLIAPSALDEGVADVLRMFIV